MAVGAYQLIEARRAAARAARTRAARAHHGIDRARRFFRAPRDAHEARVTLDDDTVAAQFPPGLPRVLACHTRPEPMLGALRRIDGGPSRLIAHGYLNRGGTLDAFGMLFANRCTWAHLAASAARLLGAPSESVLDAPERAAVEGRGDPAALR